MSCTPTNLEESRDVLSPPWTSTRRGGVVVAGWRAQISPSITNRIRMVATTDAHFRRHPVEDSQSWEIHAASLLSTKQSEGTMHRRLSHHHHSKSATEAGLPENDLDVQQENLYQQKQQARQKKDLKKRKKLVRRHKKLLKEVYAQSSHLQNRDSVHGLMIDAGSTGSRLHIFEWEPRVLHSTDGIEKAVSGDMISFPGTKSRWTDRLQPGIASFGYIKDDDQLREALAEYLQPLMDFARSVLHSKRSHFGSFPIFLRATAGMRILNPKDRARIITQVRLLFADEKYCPFQFSSGEQARVLSGEEEAIYDWTGVNFLMGDLIEDSHGSGTVVNPRHTHGALDLGGGSTQIGFYEHNEDIMANLFKLQIGQAKHWNVYAHSFLFYGMNEAINRFRARLIAGKTAQERLIDGVFDPCLPSGASTHIRTDIHLTDNQMETFGNDELQTSSGFYQANLHHEERNDEDDFVQCMNLTKSLLHLEQNAWCEFAHQGDCSLAGIYQPTLPKQSEEFGDFLAFSNYYHVWQFLGLEERSSLSQLLEATKHACTLSHEEFVAFSKGKDISAEELDSYCFRSVYVFQLLHHGYGFRMNDTIRAVRVIDGHKVGWALGAMLYEINAMPWTYEQAGRYDHMAWAMSAVVVGLLMGIVLVFVSRERHNRRAQYQPIKNVA